jgi:hypothetical protein
MTPSTIEQSFSEAGGDIVAYSIKETNGDIAIDAGENTVPAGDETTPARAFAVGDLVAVQGKIEFDGANASLGFTLPEGLRPLQNVAAVCKSSVAADTPDIGTSLVTVSTAGVVAVTPTSGNAYASGDTVDLNVLFVRG